MSVVGSRAIPLVLAVLLVTAAGDAGLSNLAYVNLHLLRGDRAFAAQDYTRAEAEYRNVLQISPGDPAAIRQLGIVWSAEGRFAQAYQLLRQAAQLDPDDAAVLLQLGGTFLVVGAYGEDRETALRILAKEPADEKALRLLADAVRTPEEIDEARRRIETLRQTREDRAEYHVVSGMLHLRQQDSPAAKSEFEEALRLDPKSGAAQFALGQIFWMRNQLEEAGRFLGAAAELAPLRSAWRLRYADFLRQTGAVGAGDKYLAEVVAKAPDYIPARTELMNIACRAKRDRDCADISDAILARDPVNYAALTARADLKLSEGKVLDALVEFDRLRALYSRLPEVHYRAALAELASGNTEAALRSLAQALKLAPDYDDAILLRDDVNISKGDLTSAIGSLTAVIKQRPQQISAHLLLADAYLKQKNNDQALAVYRQMLKIFPQDPRPPFLTGMLFIRQNQPADARMAFEECLRITSGHLPALQQLVALDLAENRVAAATKRVQAEIERHPGNARLRLLEAKIDLAQHDSAGAEVALLKAIDLDGNLEEARLLLAADYAAAHKYDQALSQLIFFAGKSNSSAALIQIGQIQTELGQFAAARDTYERLLTSDPNSGLALNNLAIIYSDRLSQLDKAYELAEKARKALPHDPHVSDTLGWIYFKKGMYHSALAQLKQSAAALPTEPEPQFHLGMALLVVGSREDARRALQRAAGASKDFPDREEARRQLEQLAKEPVPVK